MKAAIFHGPHKPLTIENHEIEGVADIKRRAWDGQMSLPRLPRCATRVDDTRPALRITSLRPGTARFTGAKASVATARPLTPSHPAPPGARGQEACGGK
jgi:hypothetical protein